jgi:phage gp46-like protein
MTDIRHIWSNDLLMGDWLIEPPDLAHDHDLETSVIISLFTDRLADPDDVLPDFSGDRRGWWGDTGPAPEDFIGSKLWLLTREKATNQTRLRAEEYCREALQWMLDDDAADQIDVAAAWAEQGGVLVQQGSSVLGHLQISIDIWRKGERILSRTYGSYWGDELSDAIGKQAVARLT